MLPDPQIARLYDSWLEKTGDANAAAVLTAAQLQSHSPAPTAALSVKQAAAELGVSKETIYKLCDERVIPHGRIGRRITITPAQLAEYQSARRAG